jgi:O-Antigen ligase
MRSLDAAPVRAPRGRSLALPHGVSLGGLVFAATLPIVFLHIDYQPAVSLPFGATFKLSDAMVLLTALTAAAAAARGGLPRLRPGLPVWVTGALLLAWIVAATFYPLASSRAYAWKTHLVTAGEFCEYALLAPAVPLLLRRRADALLAAGTLVAWSVAATVVGLAQWIGWSGLGGWGRGLRQPSFLGTHDFAALAGMTLGLGLVALLWGVRGPVLRRGAWVAVVTGVVAFVLGGATAGVVGLVPATVLAAGIAVRRHRPAARRTLAAALAATAIAAVGVVALRAGDFDQFFRFLGAKQAQSSTTKNIQTYSQRTLLAYIGARIWLHHPALGVGWQGSSEPSAFARELPAAHRRFPHVAQIAFPSAQRRYGVQVLYVQVLADLGIVGGVLLLALAGAGLLAGVRGALHSEPLPAFAATVGLFWLVLALGLWTAQGLIAGLPLDALTWLAFGLVAVRRLETA